MKKVSWHVSLIVRRHKHPGNAFLPYFPTQALQPRATQPSSQLNSSTTAEVLAAATPLPEISTSGFACGLVEWVFLRFLEKSQHHPRPVKMADIGL